MDWRLRDTPRMFLFIEKLGHEMTARKNRRCQGLSGSSTVMNTLLRSRGQSSTPYLFQSSLIAQWILDDWPDASPAIPSGYWVSDGTPATCPAIQVKGAHVGAWRSRRNPNPELSDGIPGKTTLYTKSKRDENRSVGSNSNITVPPAVTRVSCGTVCGETLGLESGGTKELRIPESVRVTTLLRSLVKFHTVSLPKLSEGTLDVGSSHTKWMIGGHHVREELASCRRETLTFVLSVHTAMKRSALSTIRLCFSPEGERRRFSRASRNRASSSW